MLLFQNFTQEYHVHLYAASFLIMAAVTSEVVAEPRFWQYWWELLIGFLFQLTTHICCPDLLLVDDIKGGAGNAIRDGVKADGNK